jgi:hypothetical protein
LAVDFDPLDAGLWNTISFNKATILVKAAKRLDTHNGVELGCFEVLRALFICRSGSDYLFRLLKLGQLPVSPPRFLKRGVPDRDQLYQGSRAG